MLGGLTPNDYQHLQGRTFNLGWNATGVIQSSIHFDADEIIIRDEMPGVVVEEVMRSVARLQETCRRRRPGGFVKAQIPLPLHMAWRREWERGPRLHGVLWKAFLTSKIEDRDYSKFLVRK